ncbi:hypothetical protein [Prevotella sp. HUN102]|nr:hypothetical protein [Prevotella sp. HUN102]
MRRIQSDYRKNEARYSNKGVEKQNNPRVYSVLFANHRQSIASALSDRYS